MNGIEFYQSSFQINSSVFKELKNPSDVAGALYFRDSNVTVYDSLFDSNLALSGGASS